MSAVLTAIGIATVGTLESSRQSRSARAATERAQAASERQFAEETKKAEIQNIRGVRQQIRQARLAQGSMTNVAAQTGGMGGSAVAGGVSSIGSQLASNLDYMGQIAAQNTAIGMEGLTYSREMANASIAGSKANEAASIASTGMTIFSAVGGPKAVQKYLS